MKEFLKPTKFTWIVLFVMFVAPALLYLLSLVITDNDFFDRIIGSLFLPYLILAFISSGIFEIFGLHTIVGGWFAYPNTLGWLSSIIFWFIIFYLFASIVSQIWLKARKNREVNPVNNLNP